MKHFALIDVAEIASGQAAPKETEMGKVGFPFIRAGHLSELISSNNIDFLPKVNTDIAKQKKLKLIPPNTILFAKSGMSATLNKVYRLQKEAYYVSHLAAIIPSYKVEPIYLQYFLSWYKPSRLILDSAYPSIKLSDIGKIQIPLPPLPEQKRIAEILNKADALRQKNKQLLVAYDELLQAAFLDMFGDPATNPMGWKEVMLDSTIQKIQIGPFGSQLHKSDYLESGIPLINPTNIKENKILFDNAACISEEKYYSMPQYHLFDGDVIMARRGDLSKVALVKQNGDRMFCGTGSLYVRFSDELNKFFLFKMLSHEKTINFLEKEARGVTMPNLNKSIIKRIPIFLPPITLQNQFAQIVENIDAQKALAKQSLDESEDLFNGLVQKAFGGEL